MCKALFTAAELAEALNGKWLGNEPTGKWSINTDSRTVKPGECFVPIVGERFDGHDFLDSLPDGVIALKAQGYAAPENLPVLEVENTTQAYQDIARYHRLRMSDLRVAAVTGSVGKTSVKEMLRAIFTEAVGEEAVLYTLGNTNNQIGVPQNLLRLNSKTRYAVIEMGTNHHGEIAPLSQCALPDGAVINTIAACHLENLGSLEGVAKEKSAVYSGMRRADCIAVYPTECAGKSVIESAAKEFKNVTFGNSQNADVSAEYLSGSLNGSEVRLIFRKINKSVTFAWSLTGRHQAENAAAAAALAYNMGIDLEVIARGLSNTTLPGKRMDSVTLNGTTWINDAYNANPQSMKSSLAGIAENCSKNSPLLLVLGDMLELGSDEISYHHEVLEFVSKTFCGHDYRILLLGKRFEEALKTGNIQLKNAECFSQLAMLVDALQKLRTPGMTIFLKSSNSIGLSKVEPC